MPRLVQGQPVPFRLERGIRIDEGPAHVALRESLVNLLVHADYSETETSLIIRSPNGYHFRNPASSRVPENDLLTGDRSDPRNPELVRMFRLVGMAEEAGTGMPKILQAWRQLGLQLPRVDVGTERYEFNLVLRHAHLLSEVDRLWLRSVGQDWTEAEQLAMVHARHEGFVDNLAVRRLTGQHPADVTKVLRSLRDRGLLDLVGWGRTARYQLSAVIRPTAPSDTIARGLAETNDRRPEGLASSSEGFGLSSEELASSSEAFARNSEDLRSIPERERMELLALARPVRERPYVAAAERDAIIIALCAHTPLSLREIVSLVGRSPNSLREPLRALVASGHLRYLYPERAHDPRQKYTAVADRTAQGEDRSADR